MSPIEISAHDKSEHIPCKYCVYQECIKIQSTFDFNCGSAEGYFHSTIDSAALRMGLFSLRQKRALGARCTWLEPCTCFLPCWLFFLCVPVELVLELSVSVRFILGLPLSSQSSSSSSPLSSPSPLPSSSSSSSPPSSSVSLEYPLPEESTVWSGEVYL